MPDQHSAAEEYAIFQQITAPTTRLPDDPVRVTAEVDFPVALRGYDRVAVDAYVQRMSQLVAELGATRSPEGAVQRALERVGAQISGVLERARDSAEQITAQSRREAEDRLEVARQEAVQIVAAAAHRVEDLDAEAERIASERRRLIGDARERLTGGAPVPIARGGAVLSNQEGSHWALRSGDVPRHPRGSPADRRFMATGRLVTRIDPGQSASPEGSLTTMITAVIPSSRLGPLGGQLSPAAK